VKKLFKKKSIFNKKNLGGFLIFRNFFEKGGILVFLYFKKEKTRGEFFGFFSLY
jgi:hypothetical protein